jgi:pre-mRNA-splicing factor 18
MEKLKAEIERKKEESRLLKVRQQQQQEETGNEENQPTEGRKMSFIRQKDRLEFQNEQIQKKVEQLEEEREAKRVKTVHFPSSSTNSASSGVESSKISNQSDVLEKKTSSVTDHDKNQANAQHFQYIRSLTVKQTQSRLRSYRQPITLFAETTEERMIRLIEYMMSRFSSEDASKTHQHEEEDEYRLHNKKKEQEKMDKEELLFDKADSNEEKKNQQNDEKNQQMKQKNGNTSDASDDEGDDEENKKKEKLNRKESSSSSSSSSSSGLRYDPSIRYSSMSHLKPEKVIYKFFRSLIKQWEYDLHQRTDYEKGSMAGKLELKNQKQCKDHIRPLFKMCQNHSVPYDILVKLALMVKYCEEGNFIKANDEYIRTAIGNSAWPIGLTMVGIHERSGRERISTSKVSFLTWLFLLFLLRLFACCSHLLRLLIL